MDGPRDCHTEWSKSDREKQIIYDIAYIWNLKKKYSSVQSLSRVWLFVTPWTAARQASLSISNSRSPPKPMSTESVIPSNHLILCHPVLLLPSIFPSIRVFSNESARCIRCPKYWSCSFKISRSNEHSGLISFRMDWLDLLAVEGTLMSFLQHHSSKASILWCSTFFTVQLSHPYMTNLDSIFRSRDITLSTKVCLGKAMVFPVVMYGCESCWTVKKSECQRTDAFELWCWRKLMRVPCTARRSNQSILKEISPGCSLEGLMLKLKLQYFGHLMRRAD